MNHIYALFIALFLVCGCSPVGKTSLLSSPTATSSDGTTAVDQGDLEIQPDSTSMSMSVDNSDRIEVTGSCKDLDRRKNRILVEVFAGDPSTVLTPYISNAISDKCQTISSGLPITDKCFWVTKGAGVVEDLGLPSERSFPQCHNGRFGFSVKLGKILETASVGVFEKYRIRLKLRTLDGILSDSLVSEITVDRNIMTPVIEGVTADQTNFACNLKMTAARFNPFVQYTLSRTYTDAFSANVPQANLFTNLNTAVIIDNDSIFSWKDDNNISTHASLIPPVGVIAGVAYTYTLTGRDNSYPYALVPTKVSNTATCTMANPVISFNGLTPTNAPPDGPTCYMAMVGARTGTPSVPVSTQWGQSTTVPAWTGPNGDGTAFVPTSCKAGFGPTICTANGLTSGTTYYFAVREIGPGGQIGRWSNVLQCKPP